MKEDHFKQSGELAVMCLLMTIWAFVLVLPKVPGAVQTGSIEDEGEPVLIIDPGHGGMDGGASTADGKTESGYNLQISLRLRDLAKLLGIQQVMTRESDELDYPPELGSIAAKKRWDTLRRTEQINAFKNGFLISIHQNYYPDAKPHGAQVLYAQGEISRRWGEATQALLKAYIDQENRRPAIQADRNIYLMSHVQRPAILVECGFLSHPQEAFRLGDRVYQIKLAAVLMESFLEITEENAI